jgi:DNA invertase Pin-like site-specific DNA recombinase
MNKIILSYCRVSTSEQSTDGAGLDNQQDTNNIAIEQLQTTDRDISSYWRYFC